MFLGISFLCQEYISRYREGRYKNIDAKDRVCHCSETAIEDEFHFLIECPSNDALRRNFITAISEKKSTSIS
jgi:hypothetical protein